MIYSHLLSILKDADMSPEQLAKQLGISGMTVRRWKNKNPHENLPLLYQKALQDVVRVLLAENRLSLDSAAVKAIMNEGTTLSMVSADNALGITQHMLHKAQQNPRQLMESLSQIGNNLNKQTEVNQQRKKILSFKKMNNEWAVRISSLMNVIQSTELLTFDKLVAYGAFSYLLFPFDLVHDYIPVFGYMDDFIVLGFAMTYYLKRFPHLFKE